MPQGYGSAGRESLTHNAHAAGARKHLRTSFQQNKRQAGGRAGGEKTSSTPILDQQFPPEKGPCQFIFPNFQAQLDWTRQ
jgi:hypothetical protein